MQTGELTREPVDGGNDDESPDQPSPSPPPQLQQQLPDVDIPLDRLVLGESEQVESPPQGLLPQVGLPPPPAVSQQAPIPQAAVNPPPALLPPPPPPGGSRIVAGSASNIEPDRNFPGKYTQFLVRNFH